MFYHIKSDSARIIHASSHTAQARAMLSRHTQHRLYHTPPPCGPPRPRRRGIHWRRRRVRLRHMCYVRVRLCTLVRRARMCAHRCARWCVRARSLSSTRVSRHPPHTRATCAALRGCMRVLVCETCASRAHVRETRVLRYVRVLECVFVLELCGPLRDVCAALRVHALVCARGVRCAAMCALVCAMCALHFPRSWVRDVRSALRARARVRVCACAGPLRCVCCCALVCARRARCVCCCTLVCARRARCVCLARSCV